MNNWIHQIDKTTEAFQTHFGHLSKEQLNWKPNPESWSIAQNLDHLIVINQSYFPILSDLKAGTYKTPFMGRIGFVVNFLGKMILDSVQVDRKKKIKTFPIWEPTNSDIPFNIIERFSKHQEELKTEIKTAKDWVKKGAVIASPANKNIVYKLETAFDIIVTHEQRHLAQAKEVLALLQKDKSLNSTLS